MINSLEHPIVIIDAIVGIFTVIILFLQLCVFRKQAGIAKKQNEIIQNQLTIDSRREHSIEIKSNLISKLKVEIEQMPYAEIKIPQFDDKDGDNWEIKIEDNFNLTKLNFFEKVKPYMPDLNLTMNNNIRDINDKNVLYNDLLDNHLGKV